MNLRGLFCGHGLGVVFELPRLVAKRFHDVVCELSVTLPGVAEQIQVGLIGLEAPQVVDRVEGG